MKLDVVVLGAFVLLAWLYVVYFEQVQRWRPPGLRWVSQSSDLQQWGLKGLAILFAIFASAFWIIMFLAAIAK